MKEIYIVIILIILLYIYLYNSRIRVCNQKNNDFYYFDDMYHSLPRLNTVTDRPPIQESMNCKDETLKHFRGQNRERFNAQLSRVSDASLTNKLSNGSDASRLHNTTVTPKNRSVNKKNDILNSRWQSKTENLPDENYNKFSDENYNNFPENISHNNGNFYDIDNSQFQNI
jgi:hypothetical protein